VSGHFYAEVKFAPCSQTRDRIVWDGLETLFDGARGVKLYRESFAPDAWLAHDPASPPTFQMCHEGEVIGEVATVIAHGGWFIADVRVNDEPRVRERVRPGAKVSVGAQSIRRYEDADLRLVRHELAKLDHIALVEPGAIPGYIGAVVTSVREAPRSKRASRNGWRGSLPAGWECLRELPDYQPQVGEELLAGNSRRAAYRFDGTTYVPVR
jgi:hypothetical protein